VHNLNAANKEGVETRSLVFVACALFLFYQFCSLFFLSQETSTIVAFLDVSTEQSLIVVPLDTKKSDPHHKKPVSLYSKESSRLSPFFFQPIPVNYSDQSLLMSIRGIGPNLANRIIQARDSKGNFTNPEELLEIKGIGPARLSSIKPYISFSQYHDNK